MRHIGYVTLYIYILYLRIYVRQLAGSGKRSFIRRLALVRSGCTKKSVLAVI